MEMDDEPKPKAPAPAVVSRRDQVKESALGFMRNQYFSTSAALQTLDLAKVRCDQMEHDGYAPRPLPLDVSPIAVFAKYKPNGLELDPGAPIEFLANSILQLVRPTERDSLFRELGAGYSTQSLRS
jgi:hypothetical protein